MRRVPCVRLETASYTTLKIAQDCGPVFGEEGRDRVGEDLALVVDVVENVLGPLHQVANLVTRR